MSVRPILLWPDPALRQTCSPIETVTADIEQLSVDLLDTMYDAPGRGLAAPQVGAMVRMFVMDASWKDGKPDPQVFVNPELLHASDDRVSQAEGCLSIPGVMTEVSRPAKVEIAWTGLTGGRYVQEFDGFAAACIQHEMDHLDGIVTFDRIGEKAREKAMKAYEALQ